MPPIKHEHLQGLHAKKAQGIYQKLGDKLAKIECLREQEAFTPIIACLYLDQGPQGGRTKIDEVARAPRRIRQGQARVGGATKQLDAKGFNAKKRVIHNASFTLHNR